MVKAIDPLSRRLRGLRREFARHKVQAMLISDPVDVGYLTGFTGDDSWLLAGGAGRPCLITDSRFTEQAEKECPQVSLLVRTGGMADAVAKLIKRRRIEVLGFDPETTTVMTRMRLRRQLSTRLVPVAGVLAALRICKDESELRAISAAIAASEAGFRAFRKLICPGMTEQRLAAELDHQMRLAGSESPGFPTICAIDESAAMPHARPGGRRLRRGSVLLVDFGARVDGYVSDLTRCLFVGKMSPLVRSVYEVVREAHDAAIAAVGPGVGVTEVDAVARRIIGAAGYAQQFQHGTGHGLGRQVHEAPSLGARAGKGLLKPGMVVTIEPGVYLKGRFGIRIEDDVLVTEAGRRVLSSLETNPEAMVL
jgi:Xaa-Pro aminopeptidase